MRDKIAKINYECCTGLPWESANEHERKGAYAHADEILALLQEEDLFHTGLAQGYKQGQNDCIQLPSLEGIEHVEKCDYCKDWTKISANCPYCHGTGEITRQAEWVDIEINEYYNMFLLESKTGRLRLKDG